MDSSALHIPRLRTKDFNYMFAWKLNTVTCSDTEQPEIKTQTSARLMLVHHAHNKCCGRCQTASQHNAIHVHGRCETLVCRVAHGHPHQVGPTKHAWSSLMKCCAGRHMQTKQELIAQQPCSVHCILILNTQRLDLSQCEASTTKAVCQNLCFIHNIEHTRHNAVE